MIFPNKLKKNVPYAPDLTKNIITEISYKDIVGSIWGEPNEAMRKFLENLDIDGCVLELGSGDGRQTKYLLESGASSVLAMDIDKAALTKLCGNVPPAYLSKLEPLQVDITKTFPLCDESVDNVFSAGTLHFFSHDVLKEICGEIDRVTKSDGRVMIQLTTNIVRTEYDGTPYIYLKDESPESLAKYSLEDGMKLLPEFFKGYKINMSYSHFNGKMREQTDRPYVLDCDYLFLDMVKPKRL